MIAPDPIQSLPVFDASSEFHQNLGLLKVADIARGKHGDAVMIRASDVRDMVLLNGIEAVDYWKSHQGHFQTEMGEIASNAGITRILLGDMLDQPENTALWDATRRALALVASEWDIWSERALITANAALLADIAAAGAAPVDLRGLCSLWSVRALVPTLYGQSLSDAEMREGLMQIEQFYYAMSTRDASEAAAPSALPEFRAARDFLDRATTHALEHARPGDETVIGAALAVLPPDLDRPALLDCLRPTLGRLLLEKLNIDGLALLWALTHVAQDAALASDMAAEIHAALAAGNGAALADTSTPLCFSAVQECLRLYPELPFIYRITSQPVELLGHTLPVRSTVVFSPWLVQRDPRYWDSPNSFIGRRFLQPLPSKSAFLPFGIGPRVRARKEFLQHQLLSALRAVVVNHDLHLAPEVRLGDLRPILRSTLAPRGAVPMCFGPRAAAPAPIIAAVEAAQA